MTSEETASGHPRRRWLWRALRWALLGLLALVALAGTALVVARLYLSDERVTELVREQLASRFAGRFAVREITWGLPLDLVLHEVAIDDPSGRPALRARVLSGSVALRSLLAGRIHVEALAGHDIDVRLIEHAGRLGLAAAFSPRQPRPEPQPEEPGGGPTIVVDVTTLTNVAFEYDSGGIEIELTRAALADARFVKRGAELELGGELTAAAARFAGGGVEHSGGALRLELTGVSARLGSSVGAERLALAHDGLQLELSGHATFTPDGERPLGAAKLSARVPLALPAAQALLARALPDAPPSSGGFALEADLVSDATSSRGAVALRGDGLRLAGVPVETLSLTGAYDGQRLEVSELTVSVDGGAAHASGFLAPKSALTHELSLTLTRFPLARAVAPFSDVALPGVVSGRLALKGDWLVQLDTEIDADLEARRLPVAYDLLPDPVHLTVDAHVRRGHAEIASLSVHGEGARLTARGRVPMNRRGSFDARLTVTHEEPQRLGARLDDELSARALTVDAEARGPFAALEAKADVQVTALRFRRWGPINLRLPLRLSGGVARIDDALLALASGTVRVRGAASVLDAAGAPLTHMPVDAEVLASGLALEDLVPDHVSGRLGLRARLGGTLQEPRVTATAALEDAIAAGVRFREARAELTVSREEIEVRRLVVAPANGGELVIAGRYTPATQRVDAGVTVSALPIAALEAATGASTGLSGEVRGQAHVQGALTDPDVNADLAASGLRLRDVALGELKLTADRQGETIHVEAALRGAGGEVRLDGSMTPRTRELSARLCAIGLPIAEWLAAAGVALPVTGALDVDARVEGALPYPRLSGRAVARELVLDGTVPPTQTLTLTLSTTEAPVGYQAHLEFGPTAWVKAHVHPEGTGALTAGFTELRASAFYPRLATAGLDLTVTGSAEATWSPRALEAALALQRLDAVVGAEQLTLARPARATYAGGVVELPELVLTGRAGTLQARARASAERLDAALRGDLNVAFVTPLVPAIAEARGVLRLDLQAHGAPAEPVVRGALVVPSELRLRPRGFAQEIVLRQGRLVLDEDRVLVERLEGEAFGGPFTIGGVVTLADLVPAAYDVQLRTENLTLATRDLAVEANADLHLGGEGLVPDVSGSVVVLGGRYLERFALEDFNFVAREPDVSVPLSETAPWLGEMALDVRAATVEPVEVRLDAAAFAIELAVETDLRITGTPLTPLLDGRIAAETGSIGFPHGELDVQQATVDFTPGLDAQSGAQIALAAEGEVEPSPTGASSRPEPVIVTMTLAGTLEEMELDFTSVPSLSRVEVMALLVTGRANLDELLYGSGGRGGTSSAEIDAAIAFAGARFTGPLSDFVERQLEDRVNLEIDVSASVTRESFRVAATKELTRRLRLEGSYEKAFGGLDRTAAARAMLLITERLFLEGITQSTIAINDTTNPNVGTESRIELKYRIFGD